MQYAESTLRISITPPRPSPWRIGRGCTQSTQAVSDCSAPPAASIVRATRLEYRAQAAAASGLDQAETEHPARPQNLAMNSSGIKPVLGGAQTALRIGAQTVVLTPEISTKTLLPRVFPMKRCTRTCFFIGPSHLRWLVQLELGPWADGVHRLSAAWRAAFWEVRAGKG